MVDAPGRMTDDAECILNQKWETAHPVDPKCLFLYHLCEEKHGDKGQ